MAGCLVAALTYFPIFKALTHYANPALEAAAAVRPVVVLADPGACRVQFNPVGTAKFTSSCDVAKSALAKGGIPYANEPAPVGTIATIRIGDVHVSSFEGGADADARRFAAELESALAAAGYPKAADPARIDRPMLLALLTLLVVYVTMVYGPIAAWLVELFPTRIRYTSMSLPYHIGNGWFGGFLPTTAFALVAATGNIYHGLWYPVVVASMTFVIGSLWLRETKDEPLDR
jgi:hypothetical protein